MLNSYFVRKDIMRDTIKEYIELSDKEKNDLWNTATFVFDTNVFLNLYRYSNKTRNQLIESFEWLKTRIWMPYQVASEFCKDRYSVIDEANKRFDNLSADADKLTDNWREELRLDCSDSDIKELGKYLKEWITKKKDLENTNFSFKELEIRLSDKDHSYALFGNKDETYKFFLSYVNEYVDFYNKTTEFSSDEFTESLDYIGKMIRNDNSRKEGTTWDITGNYLFRTSQLSFDGSMMSTLNSYFYIYNNNSTPVIIPNYNKKANAVSAFVQCGIALNNNSNNKEKALAFIQYVLSYDIQKLWSESSSSSSIVVRALPVNKAAFEYVIDHTSKRVYDINDDGEYEKSEEEYSDEIKTKFFNEYLDMINSISSCTLYDYLEFENTYYNSSVIGDIVNDYLNGDISKEKFIRQLTAATEIYLTE